MECEFCLVLKGPGGIEGEVMIEPTENISSCIQCDDRFNEVIRDNLKTIALYSERYKDSVVYPDLVEAYESILVAYLRSTAAPSESEKRRIQSKCLLKFHKLREKIQFFAVSNRKADDLRRVIFCKENVL